MGQFKLTAKKVFLFMLVICLLGGGFVFMRLKGGDLVTRFFSERAAKGVSVTIIRTTRYSKCDDTTTEEDQVLKSEVDQYLAGLSSGWEAVGGGNSSSHVYLLRTIDDFCPVHKRCRLLKLTGSGYLAIYRGKTDDGRFLLEEMESINERNLDAKTRDALRKGVIVEDDPETIDETLRLYLEGITD